MSNICRWRNARPPAIALRAAAASLGPGVAIAIALTAGCTRIEVQNDVDEPVCDVVVTAGQHAFPVGRLEPGEVWGTTGFPEDAYSGTLCARRCSASERVCTGVNVGLLEFQTSRAFIAPGPAAGVLQRWTLYLDGSGPVFGSPIN